ncbi:DUF3007 family protein [Prochlorococcus sp. MIT 1223]|uniref:DUF3007 family protein n=1 Tax=Prochlorococcus sp. MIT 1223 TaxID=3096217 RepID=UPI002A759E96|nr:DUF3007 family protein [Prochlorococcus sp. MIT 1223]
MTRAKVIQLGFLVLLLGGAGYFAFLTFGFDEASAGIAAEAVLILIVLAWTFSYFLRVINGKMTFVEQRKRYRAAYDQITNTKLKSKFESLSEEEQKRLIDQLEK